MIFLVVGLFLVCIVSGIGVGLAFTSISRSPERLNANAALEQQHRRRNDLEAGLRRRFPNATFRSVIDEELTGGTVLEADVKDWSVVRALELGIYNCYWHTPEGEYLPAGTTPDEEAMDAAKVDVAVAIREDRERQPDLSSQPGWWQQRLAEMTPYDVQELRPDEVERTRATWRALVMQAELEQPPYPWGQDVTDVLLKADVMLPPIERMAKWDYRHNDGFRSLTVHYKNGTIYRAERNRAGYWNVTVGQVS